MHLHLKQSILVIFVLVSTITIYGQNTWRGTTSKSNDDVVFVTSHMPSDYQLFSTEIEEIKTVLQDVPKRYDIRLEDSETILIFPGREGKMEAFKMLEAPIMEEALAVQYPKIKTFVGQGIDDPTAILHMSIGTDGLHAMVLAAGKPPFYIDPYTRNRDKYIVYSKSDLPDSHDFVCEFGDEDPINQNSEINPLETNIPDGYMRQYNLAVATTIEYSAYHLTNQSVPGGASEAVKKAAVLSAITTTINRVKGIYEKELGVTFVLNANETDIIFIDSDNFTNNSSSDLIIESQVEIDNAIGNANYDIGHTFSTGGGGLASLGGICTIDSYGTTSRKAKAVTGSLNPIGDAYDIDFVVHEIGHHFGANHSYNGDGVGNCSTSVSATAAEPGSGSTIMAYAGICGSLNVQQNSDAYFHIVSLKEINERLTNAGNFTHPFYTQCSTNTSTGNQEPVADAGSNYTIPKGTAFVLYGSANDPNGDAMTYCWDQIDLEQPNVYPLVSTTITGPLYRSFPPTTSPNRFMPKFETVFGGSLESTWEVTPTVGRNLNFSLTARDNRADGGQTSSDEMLVTVSSVAGPFEVTSQATEEIWATAESKTITWNVAGTTANGINTANVKIDLADDTGAVLSVLLASTPNDGSADITVPNIIESNARVRVSGINNIFYALNSNSATIAVNTTPAYCSSSCSSSGSTTFSDGTTRVVFNTIDNASTGTPAYSDYTAISTDVVKGQSYDLTVNVNTDGYFTELTKVWIDWNRNCDLSDSGEEYALGTTVNATDGSTSNSPLSITIPATATLGETKMRVSSAYHGGNTPFTPAPCSNNFWGEVEDYTVNIKATPVYNPVDLINFHAKAVENRYIRLDWKTATEENNAGFELQRGTDGKRFIPIRWIEGNGTSLELQQYQYVDKEVENNQIYYYRLKQVDFDGTFEYSGIQSSVVRYSDAGFAVYPSPASDRIYVKTEEDLNQQKDITFELFDALGRKVLIQSLDQKETSISITQIPTGVYFYKIIKRTGTLKSDKILVR
ncbi:MAG: T9SS type A sorting domain-containing protein [Bacteroidetes bacterium]|nr:T9SS type A sorting domain-containing protein [Bacteroidota bacterium]